MITSNDYEMIWKKLNAQVERQNRLMDTAFRCGNFPKAKFHELQKAALEDARAKSYQLYLEAD